jgi:hypothetical protein
MLSTAGSLSHLAVHTLHARVQVEHRLRLWQCQAAVWWLFVMPAALSFTVTGVCEVCCTCSA